MIPGNPRVFLCLEPIDMRRSFDALALLAQQRCGSHPQSGSLFCFLSRSGRRLKLLWWERNGYCILYKRLHGARFVLPDSASKEASAMPLDRSQLAELLAGIEWPEKFTKRKITH
jgi:transposase